MFVPQQSPLNYYRVHNAYQLKSACSRNQNSKASIKWKMRNGHKIIQRNIKGFRGFGLEALRLFYRIPCSKKRFDSAFRFPTIPRWSSGRLLHAGDVGQWRRCTSIPFTSGINIRLQICSYGTGPLQPWSS